MKTSEPIIALMLVIGVPSSFATGIVVGRSYEAAHDPDSKPALVAPEIPLSPAISLQMDAKGVALAHCINFDPPKPLCTGKLELPSNGRCMSDIVLLAKCIGLPDYVEVKP